MWLALVVFTSGIVDEGPLVGSWPSQYYLSSLLVGVEPGGRGAGWGGDTLLGPEGSGPGRAGVSRWGRGVGVLCLLCPVLPGWVGWGVGGRASCDLNSGREHLVADLHQDPSQLSDELGRMRVVAWSFGAGRGVVCGPCLLRSLCSFC